MYLVTKRIDFCYGHRLLDYDGICKHPHGHNAVAEIDVRTEELDKRNFRKKILGMELLEPLDEYQQDVAHRAAQYYRFHRARYEQLTKRGFLFEL